jgi:hypothetical protein
LTNEAPYQLTSKTYPSSRYLLGVLALCRLPGALADDVRELIDVS